MAEDLEVLVAWVRSEAAALMESGQNWQIVINAGKGGDLRYEAKKTGEIRGPRKSRANGGWQ